MYTTLLFLHFLGLAMAVGTGFAFLRLGRAFGALPPAEKGPLFAKFAVLRLNTYSGFALLILTGLGMTALRPGLFAAAGGAFHVKLTLVVLMLLNMGVMHMMMAKARRAGGPPPAKLMTMGNVNFSMGILTILMAVLAFH
jgi:uncharacterized membrane protein